MGVELKGPWDDQEVARYLRDSLYPMRLACIGSDGFPRVISVWYMPIDGLLCAVSHRSSQLIAMLDRCQRVGFEVAPNEPPYCGVRGQGIVTLRPDENGALLKRLIERYLGDTGSPLASWLLSRAEDEVLISVQPTRLFSWDYRGRMS